MLISCACIQCGELMFQVETSAETLVELSTENPPDDDMIVPVSNGFMSDHHTHHHDDLLGGEDGDDEEEEEEEDDDDDDDDEDDDDNDNDEHDIDFGTPSPAKQPRLSPPHFSNGIIKPRKSYVSILI